jgi:hypothetical protein
MNKPAKFIMNSDYATLANDSDTTTISVSIPATSITSGTPQTYTGTATVGTIGSPIEFDINYSMSARRWKTPALFFVENTGAANQYQGNVNVYKSAASTVTVQVVVFYGGAGSITKTARTVTVRVKTFIPPFN